MSDNHNTMASDATERTPLLGGPEPADGPDPDGPNGKGRHAVPSPGHGFASRSQRLAVWFRHLLKVHVEKRILLAGFLITLSFSITQIP
jgi:hypothetical protein